MANTYNTTFNQDDLDTFLANDLEILDNYNLSGLMTDTDTEFEDPEIFNPAGLPIDGDFNNTGSGYALPQEMLPVQPQAQQQMSNTAMGPCYHPMVGWYYPAASPVGIPPPPMIPVVGMAPATSMPMSGTSNPAPAFPKAKSPLPSRTSFPAASGPRAQGKRKYGPGAYLDARAEGRNSVDSNEANYFASRASRREGRGDVARGASDSVHEAFNRRRGRPSIVQACVCDDREATRIKRPRNPFILYRLSVADEIRKSAGTKHNAVVSSKAAQMWKDATSTTKNRFREMAAEEKKRHAEKYPEYKYRPGGQLRTKFGTKDCMCGAYTVNLSRFHERREGRTTGRCKNDDVEDGDGDDAYATPRGSSHRQAAAAPTAVMVPPPDLDIASLDLPLNQQAEAAATYAGLKRRHHNLTVSVGRDEEEQPVKRRPSRASARNVNYTEPGDLPDTNFDDLFDFGATYKTPRLSLVNAFQPFPNSKQGKSPSLLFMPASPPTKKKRVHSRASIVEPDSPLTPIDEFAMATPKAGKRAPSPTKIAADDGDTRAVATRSTRSQRKESKTDEVSTRSTRLQTARRRSLRSGAK